MGTRLAHAATGDRASLLSNPQQTRGGEHSDVTSAALEPRRHAPPEGWNAQTFETVTSALAAALVAAYRTAANGPEAP